MSTFMVVFSKTVGMNLSNFYASWGWKDLPGSSDPAIADLPMWDETPHTTVPPGV
jgi:hypothetical protein